MADSKKKHNGLRIIIIIISIIALIATPIAVIQTQKKSELEQDKADLIDQYAGLKAVVERQKQKLQQVSGMQDINTAETQDMLTKMVDHIDEEMEKLANKETSIERKDYDEFRQRLNALNNEYQARLPTIAEELSQEFSRKTEKIEKRYQDSLENQKTSFRQELTQLRDSVSSIVSKQEDLSRLENQIEELLSQQTQSEQVIDSLLETINGLEARKDSLTHIIAEKDSIIQALQAQNSQNDAIFPNVYFVYRENSRTKQTAIILTEAGLSKRYLKYFKSRSPDVQVQLSYSRSLMTAGTQKIDFILSDSTQVLRTFPIPSKKDSAPISLDGNLFKEGSYFEIKIQIGNRNLLDGEKYVFRIKEKF